MLTFPTGFLWGVSTSAHQFEGGNLHNQWHEWEQRGQIRSGHQCAQACDWWSNASGDLDLCRDLGLSAIRIALDWGRLEPIRGRWNYEAFENYRTLLQLIRARGMRPFVTLHHFTHPAWFEQEGAFLNGNLIPEFVTYAEKAVEQLQDLCCDWLTFNEPNVYAMFGYMFGEFPPGGRNRVFDIPNVLSNIHRAHALAYAGIHKLQSTASVGLTTNWTEFQAATTSPADRFLAYIYDGMFNRSTLQLLRGGSLSFPFGALAPDVPEVIDKTDFIGVNVYNRLHVRSPFELEYRRTGGLFVPPDVPQGDPGTEFAYGEAYPGAVTNAVREYGRLRVPIYVMENGVPDASDRIRPWVIVNTLKHMHELISEGFDVRGYFHWSIVDNFEWSEGWTLRFGLYGLNPQTQQREPRFSASLYKEIAGANGVSDEQLSRFSEPPSPTAPESRD
jgi:beta-glucosidase